MKRANTCLALYYDPDNDPETKAAVRESFVRSLDDIPVWAMYRAFDRWERNHARRPSPAEVRILAEREIAPLTDEVKRRRLEDERADAEQATRDGSRVTREAARDIMDRIGFTPKLMADLKSAPMAGSMIEAKDRTEADGSQHWSAWGNAADHAAMTKARDANEIIQANRKPIAAVEANP